MRVKKKIRKIILFLFLVILSISVITIISINKKRLRCNSINITILDSNENYFITKNDVLQLIYKSYGNVIGYNFDSINIALIEKKLNNNSYIKKAEVYKTIRGTLNVDIIQRNPILRIINNENKSLYIDIDGVIIPVSDNFTSHEILANGNIKTTFSISKTKEMPRITEGMTDKIIYDLYILSKFIEQDNFLKAQIEQIYVTENKEFELVPRVGNQIIEFGTIVNYEEKFRNLLLFYQKGIPKLGWEKYSKINIKYKNQIVCTIK